MNDDFETKLQSLADELHRPDPTPPWKAEILAIANAARASTPSRPQRLPNWLLLSWAVCWVTALALHFMTPDNPNAALAARSGNIPSMQNSEEASLTVRKEMIEAMLAQNDLTLSTTRP